MLAQCPLPQLRSPVPFREEKGNRVQQAPLFSLFTSPRRTSRSSERRSRDPSVGQPQPTLPSPVDGADAGHRVIVTDSLCQQPVPDLPGKHGRILAFILSDFFDHFGSGNLWFGSANHPRLDASCFIIPRPKRKRPQLAMGAQKKGP